MSGVQVDAGVAGYLQAFATSAERTVAFVRTHQQPYLPMLISTLQDYISGRQEAEDPISQQKTGCQGLLGALDPGGTWSSALSPEALLRSGRYEDCRAACSRALESNLMGSQPQGKSMVLVPLRARVKVGPAVPSQHAYVLVIVWGGCSRGGGTMVTSPVLTEHPRKSAALARWSGKASWRRCHLS